MENQFGCFSWLEIISNVNYFNIQQLNSLVYMDFTIPGELPCTLAFDATTGKFRSVIRGKNEFLARWLVTFQMDYMEGLAKLFDGQSTVYQNMLEFSWLTLLGNKSIFGIIVDSDIGQIHMRVRYFCNTSFFCFDAETYALLSIDLPVLSTIHHLEIGTIQKDPRAEELAILMFSDPSKPSGIAAFCNRFCYK